MADLTIRLTQRQLSSLGSDPPPSEQTVFVQSDRRREDLQGWFGFCLRPHGRTMFRLAPRTALITRCDLMRAFHLNLEDREYTSWPLQNYSTREQLCQADVRGQDAVRREPTVRVETETIDTAERKEFFGHTARHVITTRRVIPLHGAQREPSKTVTDGWYIDLETHVSCDPWWRSGAAGHAFLTGHVAGKEGDVPLLGDVSIFEDIGEPERGYVISSVNTSYDRLTLPNGSTAEHVFVTETEVTQLSTAEIDPVIFEVPAGFRAVERIRQDPTPPLSIRAKQTFDRFAHRFNSTK